MNDLDHYLSHSDTLMSNVSDDYLSHHGIDGQKWGQRNGPPYPLSDKKHDRVVKRAAKRRQKILKDPKKLYKHQSEFTTEELATALDKIRVAKAVQREIPGKKKKKTKLSIRKKQWAKDANSLTKHVDKYSKEEFEAAKEILDRRDYLYDKRMKKYSKPKDAINLTSDYLKSASNLIGTGKKLKDSITPYDPSKLTNKEKHALALAKQGYAFLVDPKLLNTKKDTAGGKDYVKYLEKNNIPNPWASNKQDKKEDKSKKKYKFNGKVRKVNKPKSYEDIVSEAINEELNNYRNTNIDDIPDIDINDWYEDYIDKTWGGN